MPKKKSKAQKSYSDIDDLIKDVNKDNPGLFEEKETNLKGVSFQTTNIIGLDWVMGGGRPRGRIIEVFGPESSGKTSLCLHLIGICQRLEGKAVLVDAEYAWEPNYAKTHKINPSELEIVHPDNGEQALQVTEKLVKSGLVDLIVIDSVAALVPKAEAEGNVGDHHIGVAARMMSQSLRKLTAAVSRSKCTVIFINQLRTKIGIMFGNPETTTGGNALKFYSSIRLDVRRAKWLGDKDNPIGIIQKVKAVKNKVAPPYRMVELTMSYKNGYSVAKDLVTHCLNFGVIKQSGPSYKYNGNLLAKSKKDLYKVLKKNNKLRKKLKSVVKKVFNEQNYGEEDE